MENLRPCIVRIKKDKNQGRNHIREIEIEEHKGYFHKWSDVFWTIGESHLVGGYSAGQMSQTFGIVEYEDGTVHQHYPYEIQFTDRSSV